MGYPKTGAAELMRNTALAPRPLGSAGEFSFVFESWKAEIRRFAGGRAPISDNIFTNMAEELLSEDG